MPHNVLYPEQEEMIRRKRVMKQQRLEEEGQEQDERDIQPRAGGTYSSSYFSNSRYGIDQIVCMHKIGKDAPEVKQAKATASRKRKAGVSTNFTGQKREAKGPTINQRLITTFDGNFRDSPLAYHLNLLLNQNFGKKCWKKLGYFHHSIIYKLLYTGKLSNKYTESVTPSKSLVQCLSGHYPQRERWCRRITSSKFGPDFQ
jgi:hypothetical protein